MYVLFLLKTLYPIWLVLLLPPNLPSPISCFCILLSLSWLSMSHFISISPMICLPMLLELHRMSKAMQIINHFNIFQGNYQYQQWTPIIQSPPPSPLPAVTRLEVTGGCLLEHWMVVEFLRIHKHVTIQLLWGCCLRIFYAAGNVVVIVVFVVLFCQ